MELLPTFVITPRMTLRAWTPDDVDRLSAAVQESLAHLRPWMPWAAAEPLPRAERLTNIRGWQAAWARGGDVVMGMFHEDEVVGGSGLHHRGLPDSLEIGYWVHAAHTGRGFATETARALTSAAFRTRPLAAVEIHHDRANLASRAVPARLGFTPAGERPDTVDAPGEEGVDCAWRLTREQWEAWPPDGG